ncbi:hypothetical protein A4A49_33239 [Nicotiana attenuata]|uniref:Uncharacterized protein n=1 Tax=Nicotiana attenuata TaxID=49451 RepID=A0A1J6JY61_NICAT|nr:hypothetical protein A4A49_33239 [Nicotiana attenuata]
MQKESTAAWVNRTFAENVVATNQSCQEIPSRATEFDAVVKEGVSGEEESSDEEKKEEEQSVNGKANKECRKSDLKGGTSSEVIVDQREATDVNNQENAIAGDQPVQKINSPSPNKVLPPAKPNIGPDILVATVAGTEGVIANVEGEGIGGDHGKNNEGVSANPAINA